MKNTAAIIAVAAVAITLIVMYPVYRCAAVENDWIACLHGYRSSRL